MDDCIDLEFGEQLVYCFQVAEIHLDERDIFPTSDFFYTFETGHVAIRHIVGYYYIIARLDQFDCHVAADESGTA